MDYREEIAQNIAGIREKMNAAARAAGRDPQEILLVRRLKNERRRPGQGRRRRWCRLLRGKPRTGVDTKQPLGAYTGKPVHFIGHLQTNKVKQVVGAVDLIQSVDRLELLECIEKAAAKKGLVQDILLEINIGQEESKSGFTVAESWEIAAAMSNYPHVRLRGLMAIPPVSEKKGDNLRYFAEMRNLFVDIGAKKYDNVSMDCLSMGMSDDFEDAISAGSTMIRVGTAIFGARHYNK